MGRGWEGGGEKGLPNLPVIPDNDLVNIMRTEGRRSGEDKGLGAVQPAVPKDIITKARVPR